MKRIDKIEKEIQSLPIIQKAENAWENNRYKPYSIKLIELNKVIQIIKQNKRKTISDLIKDIFKK